MLAQPPADLLAEPHQDLVALVPTGDVALERHLVADRLGISISLDAPRVLAATQRPEVRAGPLAELAHQLLARARLQVTDGVVARGRQLLLGDGAGTPQALHRQRREKPHLFACGHHDGAIGLVEVGGDLGDELRSRHADRNRERRLGPHPRLDLGGDLLAGAEGLPTVGHVEEGLVQGQRLHQRSERPEDGAHLLGNPGVDLHPGPDEDAVRTAAPGHRAGQSRVHTEPPGLVGGRGNHPAPAHATDDDRHAAQRRVVPLLDGRVERVHVGVEDGARPAHGPLMVPRIIGAEELIRDRPGIRSPPAWSETCGGARWHLPAGPVWRNMD